MISVRSSLLKGSIKTISLICFGITLFSSQSAISIAADYPPIPAPSLSPAPLPSPNQPAPTNQPAPSLSPAPLPSSPPSPTPPAPTNQPAPTPTILAPITLPAVAAPLQTVIANSNERPAAPPVPVNANTISQVSVDGRFVNINIAPQKSPTPGTVGVAVTGDGFNFSLSTTSDNGGKTTIGSVSIINGQPVVNTPQQTTINTTGTGFKPNDLISIYVFSVGKFLGNAKTSGIGEFNANVKLPNLPIGLHHFQATGLTSEGKTRTITLFMNITPETVAKPAAQSSRLLIILTVILLIIVQALVFIWRLFGKRRKKEKEGADARFWK